MLAKSGWGVYNLTAFGAWLRPVERTVRVREVVGSNPAAPTSNFLAYTREARRQAFKSRPLLKACFLFANRQGECN